MGANDKVAATFHPDPAPEPMADLVVDPNRLQYDDTSGIYVRATLDGKWGSYDFVTLTQESLHEFARSRGPVSDWAMALLDHVLGHPRA